MRDSQHLALVATYLELYGDPEDDIDKMVGNLRRIASDLRFIERYEEAVYAERAAPVGPPEFRNFARTQTWSAP